MSGKLVSNCGAVYFPSTLEPDLSPVPSGKLVENVISLTWSEPATTSSQPFDGVVLFKVKSSTPTKFHVHPRFGAIDVVDGVSKAAEVSISLRKSMSEDSKGRSQQIHGSQPAAPVSDGATEKFLIEYLLVAKPSVVVSTVRGSGDAGTAKRVVEWYDEAKLQSGSPGKILLKGFMENVYTEEQLKQDATLQDQEVVFVVPATAVVSYQTVVSVRHSARSVSRPTEFRDQSSETLAFSPSVVPVPAAPPVTSSNNTPSGGAPNSKLAYIAELDEETHSLRLEVDRLKSELQRALEDKKAAEASVAAVAKSATELSALSSSGSLSAAQLKGGGGEGRQDSRDREPVDGGYTRESTSQGKRKKGVPFLVVLALMVLTFVATFYLRLARGWGPQRSEGWEGIINWPVG
jgi:hypothetical protein